MFRFRHALLALAAGFSLASSSPLFSQVELISGFNFGQFIGGGYPSTDGLNGNAIGFVRSNFARNVAPIFSDSGIFKVANSIETPFSAGVAVLYFDGSNGSHAWDFSGGSDVYVEERGSLVAINHSLVNGAQMINGDDNNAGLGFVGGANTDFSIVVNTTGWSDFDPAGFSQPNDFNFTFSAFAKPGSAASIQWLHNGSPVGAPIAVAPGEFQAFNLDLPSSFYGRSDATLVGRVTGELIIDHVQINGVPAAAPVFEQQPQSRSVTAGADVSFTVAVSGAASPTYRWRRNGVDLADGPGISGAATATLTLSNVAVSRAGSYTVVVNNNGASAESEAAVLTINTLPAISEQPSSASANPGETIVFEVEASGSPAPSFRWRKDGVDLSDDARISGSATATLTIAGLTAGDEGDYTVVVTNVAGSVTSAAAVLSITDDTIAPTIQQQPVSATVVVGATATFRVNASGAPAPTYRWLRDGEPLSDGDGISGSTTATLRVTPSSLAAAGAYRVRVTNSAGEIESDPAVLTVQVSPSIPSGSGPTGTSLALGARLALSVSAAGTPAPTYQWRKNGEDIPGQTGPELVIDPVTQADAGDYTVVITNPAGSVESDVATVVVLAPPAIVTPPASQTIGLGGRVVFTVTASGSGELAYQWRKDGEDIPGAEEAAFTIPAAALSDGGAYTVLVSNAAGLIESPQATLAIAVLVDRGTPRQDLPPGTRLLLDSGFSADAGYRFQWLKNGRAIAGATGSTFLIESSAFADSGSYSVRVFAAGGRLLATRSIAKVVVGVAGVYDALLRDAGDGEPLGRATVNVASSGGFTAKLTFVDGKTYSFKGRLAFPEEPHRGVALAIARRTGGRAELELDLVLDSRERTLSLGLGEAGAEAGLAVAAGALRLAVSAPADWSGVYSLELAPQPTELPDQPQTSATLKAVIGTKGGAMKLTGKLADNTKVTASVPSSVGADYAVWIRLYSGAGRLAGALHLAEDVETAEAAVSVEPSAEFSWFRPANPKSKVFPGGIDLRLAPDLVKQP